MKCRVVSFVSAAVAVCGAASPAASADRATLAILATSDLHANVMSWDYYAGKVDPAIGLERTASLIAEVRQEFPDNILLDDGDTIQGTPLGDYQARVKPIVCGETLAIFKAMNALRYDAATIGNHEFNFGLDYLEQVTHNGPRFAACGGPRFPLVLSNVTRTDGTPLYPPYVMLKRTLAGHALKVGVIGLTPPQIMAWDRRNLEGRVTARDVIAAAKEWVPKVRAAGADLVVVLLHGGPSAAIPTDRPGENVANFLAAEVPGIDVLITGHLHKMFPEKGQFDGLPDVDAANGRLAGVPSVMPGFWGNRLGIVALDLQYANGHWTVAGSKQSLRAAADAAPDPAIAPLVAAEHQATLAYVATPIGRTDFRIATEFALAGDVAAVEIVTAAQRAFAAKLVAEEAPEAANLPILSASAPYRMNFGGTGYADIKPGEITIKDASSLYPYTNTFAVLRLSGTALKAWLEKSANVFNQVDPASAADQMLVNTHVPNYQFDVIDGVTYEIDVTRPVGDRIRNLRHAGKPVAPADSFLLASNNYRAGGASGFPGSGETAPTLLAKPTENRAILTDYLRARGTLTRARDGADRNWRFARASVQGRILIEVGDEAADARALAAADGIAVTDAGPAPDGKGELFAVDLSR